MADTDTDLAFRTTHKSMSLLVTKPYMQDFDPTFETGFPMQNVTNDNNGRKIQLPFAVRKIRVAVIEQTTPPA